MPKFAANLTMMFNEVEFLDRFEAASKARFNGVEYLFPYDYSKDDIAERLEKFGMTQVLFDLPAGDWDGGDRGNACQPDRVGEFQEGVGKAIEYANALGCRQVTCLAGIIPEGVEHDDLLETFISNLKFAAPKLKEAGVRLLIEPINIRDIPGFFLNHTSQARAIIEQVGSDNVFLQHDIYHMQIMEGDLARTIENNMDIIRHFQIADNPGRNEPGTGEINYPFLFKHIDGLGYDGWIGCEYRPLKDTTGGLLWIAGHV